MRPFCRKQRRSNSRSGAPRLTSRTSASSRDATVDGIAAAEGDFLALLDGQAFAASPDLAAVLDRLLDSFSQDGRSFVQVLRGEGAPDAEEIERRIGARGIEADVKWGGQPHYPLLLSAE